MCFSSCGHVAGTLTPATATFACSVPCAPPAGGVLPARLGMAGPPGDAGARNGARPGNGSGRRRERQRTLERPRFGCAMRCRSEEELVG